MCKLELLDFIKNISPTIVGIVALFVADKHISKQARLSIKIQWLESFRNNTVKLLTKHYNFLRSYKYPEQTYSLDAYTELLEQISLLRILLKENDIEQNELKNELNDLISLIKATELNMTKIGNKVGMIYNKCEKILAKQEDKL